MDCLRAQALLSAELDEPGGDATELYLAKEHCRTCQECGAFVRALLAVRQAGTPAPPDDLADRVMARIRAESSQARQIETRSIAADSAEAGPGMGDESPSGILYPSPAAEQLEPPSRTWRELYERSLAPRNRRALVLWSTAAAVLFVAAGISARAGVRAILVPRQAAETIVSSTEYSGGAENADLSAKQRVTQEESPPVTNAEKRFFTVGTNVYRFAAVAVNVDKDALEVVGESRTSLDSDGRAKSFDVMGAPGSTRVYVIDDNDRMLAFELVTRSYAGRPYALQSAPIERFGQWPTLPSELRTPKASDGSPTFQAAKPDESGVVIFTLKGASAESGIAFPPNQPSGDPLAGSSDWSWWIPVR